MALEDLDKQTLELLFSKSIDNIGDLVEIVKKDCRRHDWAISSDAIEVDGERKYTLEVIIDEYPEMDLNPPPIGAVLLLVEFGFLGEFSEKSRYGEERRRVVMEAPISITQEYK